MKILNLYAGIGGNRKLWEGVEVTAVENDYDIAMAYKELYPNDIVLIEDAHQYLLDFYHNFDFIWSSPPCPSHSRMRTSLIKSKPMYPDMKLYEEIIFLNEFFKGNYVVENVIPYYKPLLTPTAELDRHLFWSNKHIGKFDGGRSFKGRVTDQTKEALAASHGIELPDGTKNQRKLLRNAVDPILGLHVFQAVGLQIRSEVRANLELFSELAPSNVFREGTSK